MILSFALALVGIPIGYIIVIFAGERADDRSDVDFDT